MSNLTLLRLTKLQPVFHMVGSSYVDVAYAQNLIDSSGNGVQNNHSSSDNFLLLLEENYSYRSTSTIVLMVAAWILLILGFVFCCCAECFGISVWRGKKRGGSIESVSTSAGSIAAGVAVTASSGVVRSDLHADRANHNEATIEVCRHCPPDYEAESLPSYTIVSGLPTYDDALEEFRKAGIILTPAFVPVIKIFESVNNEAGGAKEPAVSYTLVENPAASSGSESNGDNISLTSITCNCGAGGGGNSPGITSNTLPSYSAATAAAIVAASPSGAALTSQVIELSPEHLASLSQKRLSLQISFNNSLRRRSRSRSTLRNHLLRSRAVGNTAGLGPIDATVPAGVAAPAPTPRDTTPVLTPIHRSSSTLSLSNERQLLDQRLRHLHHRGSLY